jgi:hypothetical protein
LVVPGATRLGPALSQSRLGDHGLTETRAHLRLDGTPHRKPHGCWHFPCDLKPGDQPPEIAISRDRPHPCRWCSPLVQISSKRDAESPAKLRVLAHARRLLSGTPNSQSEAGVVNSLASRLTAAPRAAIGDRGRSAWPPPWFSRLGVRTLTASRLEHSGWERIDTARGHRLDLVRSDSASWQALDPRPEFPVPGLAGRRRRPGHASPSCLEDLPSAHYYCPCARPAAH